MRRAREVVIGGWISGELVRLLWWISCATDTGLLVFPRTSLLKSDVSFNFSVMPKNMHVYLASRLHRPLTTLLHSEVMESILQNSYAYNKSTLVIDRTADVSAQVITLTWTRWFLVNYYLFVVYLGTTLMIRLLRKSVSNFKSLCFALTIVTKKHFRSIEDYAMAFHSDVCTKFTEQLPINWS